MQVNYFTNKKSCGQRGNSKWKYGYTVGKRIRKSVMAHSTGICLPVRISIR